MWQVDCTLVSKVVYHIATHKMGQGWNWPLAMLATCKALYYMHSTAKWKRKPYIVKTGALEGHETREIIQPKSRWSKSNPLTSTQVWLADQLWLVSPSQLAGQPYQREEVVVFVRAECPIKRHPMVLIPHFLLFQTQGQALLSHPNPSWKLSATVTLSEAWLR